MRFYGQSFKATMAMPFPAFYALYARMEAIRAKEMVADHDTIAHGTNTANGGEPKLRNALTGVEKQFIRTEAATKNGADPNWKKKMDSLRGVTATQKKKKR
ncbi:hypothetical protein LF599_07555 [Pseudodesulfovibrio thermohalotolerans]|uniref:hypothetical protein n=1 Tax=Pseudodesulfovibrio thermohalotolerans TaxID=2880651 RepID=UPI0024435D7F|nr:hypothetical protein [Pseudodesulfovibrio thermohalotolerans]WFS64010.1 hypothetical protein LF599_07555 [Pseudodesulfovibrio thermohalotolerans]